jgi:diguanylate cyclase (GGDEF)-like protein
VSTAPHPSPRRLRGGAAVAGVLIVLAALVAALGLAAPQAQSAWDVGYVAQALAQAVAALACLAAARTAVGPGRLAWGLLCAGQALLALTNLGFAVVDGLVETVPEVSAFDVLWLAYYAPMLGAVAVFYRRRRPEPGWIGVVDALILTGALTLIIWEAAITPLADAGAGGLEGATVNTLYPTLDLFGLSVMAWLAIRQRGRPPWLTWIAASFGAAVVADGIYLRGALVDAPSAIGVSAAVYILAAALLVVAAAQRRAAGAIDVSDVRAGRRPRAWIQVVPFVLVVPLLVIVSDGRHDPVVDTIADAVIAIVIARLSWSVVRLDSLRRENERLLVTDPLTGAHNRRFLAEEIVRLAARARRDGSSLAVIMLDLDRFKLVNDTLGHAVGDRFLQRAVERMRTRLRAGDVLCRMGGDEFVVLLPGTDEAGAVQLTERLQEAVAAARDEVCPQIAVGGSFGTAAQAGATLDAAGLLQRADTAMYAAKRAGGARTLPWRQDTADRLGLEAGPVTR